jgi:ElaB/YqjD/DUF883 family membrane-anchored ribosome-binding protein
MAETNRGTDVRDKAHELAGAAKQTGQEAMRRMQDTASSATQKAQDVAANLGQKARETVSGMGHRAQEAASTAADKADSALSNVGQSMSSLAGTIREKAPNQGTFGSAATAVAEGLDSSGHYLQDHGLSDIGEDFTSLIKHYPLQSLCVAFCCGLLLGMATRR